MATSQKTALMETSNKYKDNNGHVLTHVQTIRHATKAAQKPINHAKRTASPNTFNTKLKKSSSNLSNANGTTNHSKWIAHVIVTNTHCRAATIAGLEPKLLSMLKAEDRSLGICSKRKAAHWACSKRRTAHRACSKRKTAH